MKSRIGLRKQVLLGGLLNEENENICQFQSKSYTVAEVFIRLALQLPNLDLNLQKPLERLYKVMQKINHLENQIQKSPNRAFQLSSAL